MTLRLAKVWRCAAIFAVLLAGVGVAGGGPRIDFAEQQIIITPVGAVETTKDKPAGRWTPGAKAKRAVKKVTGALSKVTKQVFGIFGGDKPVEKKRRVPETNSIQQPTSLTGNTGLSNQPTKTEASAAAAMENTNAQAVLEAPAPIAPTNAKCEKAKATIGKYAFTDIEVRSCNGEVLRFAALRNGVKFLLEVHARSGDLINVEKLVPPARPTQIEIHPRPY